MTWVKVLSILQTVFFFGTKDTEFTLSGAAWTRAMFVLPKFYVEFPPLFAAAYCSLNCSRADFTGMSGFDCVC